MKNTDKEIIIAVSHTKWKQTKQDKSESHTISFSMSCIFFLVVLIGLFEFLSKEFPFVFISTLTDTVSLFSLIFFSLPFLYVIDLYLYQQAPSHQEEPPITSCGVYRYHCAQENIKNMEQRKKTTHPIIMSSNINGEHNPIIATIMDINLHNFLASLLSQSLSPFSSSTTISILKSGFLNFSFSLCLSIIELLCNKFCAKINL